MTVIAHLSDMHLDGSPGRLRRFEAVLAQVAELARVDVLVLTGDLTEHGEASEYAQFFDALPELPAVVVPGNHDRSDPLRSALRERGRPASMNTSLLVGGVHMVGLDSHVDDEDAGELGAETIEYARGRLVDATGPVVLAMHHPPVPVGHHVMDRYGLDDGDALAALIRQHDTVIGVFTGHVHTALATTFAGVPLIGAPGIVSTMRLGSKTEPIADSGAMPGLAVHTIHESVIRTVFHYLSPSAL